MLPCVCSVIDHRGCQNKVRTLVTYLAIASCATFLFSTFLTSSVIYNWPDTQQHGIYLLNRNTVLNQSEHVFALGYYLIHLTATCSKIAQTSIKVWKTRLLRLVLQYSEHKREHQSKLSTDHSSGERRHEIVEVHFAGDRYYKQTSVTTCTHCVTVFTKIKLLIINRRQVNWIFCHCSPQNHYIEVFDITNPRYNEQISHVP